MPHLLVQVNMGTHAKPAWAKINRFDYDSNLYKPQWSPEGAFYIDWLGSAKKKCTDSIRAWSTYHKFVGRQFRILNEFYKEGILRQESVFATTYTED
jgi:hypothetical protein